MFNKERKGKKSLKIKKCTFTHENSQKCKCKMGKAWAGKTQFGQPGQREVLYVLVKEADWSV